MKIVSNHKMIRRNKRIGSYWEALDYVKESQEAFEKGGTFLRLAMRFNLFDALRIPFGVAVAVDLVGPA